MDIDLGQLEFIRPKLRAIALYLEERTGLTLTVTSLYRINDTGVHGATPLRGIDFRMRSPLIGEAFENMVNCRWVYDPDRPEKQCAVLHGRGSNLHLHVQVHDNTELR